MKTTDYLKQYIEILLEYNQKVNLVSRKITTDDLDQLLKETLLLDRYINYDHVIDAGSGNGILGVPLAIVNPYRRLILVETKKKKVRFLQQLKKRLKLKNLDILGVSIEEYLLKQLEEKREKKTLISRGFPQFTQFSRWVKQGIVTEAIIITSMNKIKKNEKALEIVKKKIYNIPWREQLKILKMANKEINLEILKREKQ
jgi:16S rRNA (guanine527-N7)-methyltransferase